MNWLYRLEQKFGKYAITNLPLYIVMLYAVGAVLDVYVPWAPYITISI